jgi:DNA-binding transcriptional MocR family regulator
MKQISEQQLVRLIRGWTAGPGTKPTQLSTAIRELLGTHELPTGAQLPSERALASVLGVSRNSVTEAYGQLRDAGWLESRRGSGSRLRRPGPGVDAPTYADIDLVEGRLSSFSERRPDVIDFSSGALGGLPMVAEVIAQLQISDVASVIEGDGYEPQGLTALREEIAKYYSAQGVETDANSILITSGAQQALEVISRSWIDPGDQVIVEDPSYRGALEVFRNRGARLLTTPMRQDGPDIQVLDRMTRVNHPRFVYLLPTAHNPTGLSMSLEKRAAVCRLANERGLVIVEDASPADLLLSASTPPRPLIADLDPGIAVSIGSVSKLFWGGLRIGWIRASKPIISHLVRGKAAMDLGSSLVSQEIATRLMNRVDEARTIRRQELGSHLEDFESRLIAQLPEWTWERPSGGAGMWVRSAGADTVELAQAARRRGLSVMAGPTFSAVGSWRSHLRLPFTNVGAADQALEILRSAWEETPKSGV